MAEIITLTAGHPVVGTWRDADEHYGSRVQFTIHPAGATFEITALDNGDGEQLSISNVRWDGRVLCFDGFVPSTGHRAEYAFQVMSPSEVQIRSAHYER